MTHPDLTSNALPSPLGPPERAALGAPLPVMWTGENVLFPALTVPVTVALGPEARAIEAAANAPARLLVLIASSALAAPAASAERADPVPYGTSEESAARDGTGARVAAATGAVAVLGRVLRMSHGDETIHALVLGLARVRVEQVLEAPAFPTALVHALDEFPGGEEAQRLHRDVLAAFGELAAVAPAYAKQLADAELHAQRPGDLADFIAANAPFKPPERQRLLETVDVVERLREVLLLLQRETERQRLSAEIEEDVQHRTAQREREFLLREQMEAIRQELGETSGSDVAGLRRRLDAALLTPEARQVADREILRLDRISPLSPEYSTVRGYLEWIAALPWGRRTPDHLDLDRASAVLDEDHYGLEKVKERILEYLAVRKLRNDARGPILCFVGPPGVGKTSLGRSIARALGREFARASLGGIRDEAAIRGFRRTYIGALPGWIVQALRRAETNNPVIMLDEVDKISGDARGDPASALLEVLDPAQNAAFVDHYLEIPIDLSTVFFICTANQADTISPPLLDRMETIDIPSYTDEEKLQIARRYLLPRRLTEAGLTETAVRVDDDALRAIISGYTREAGVRALDRAIGAVVRGVALRIARGDTGTAAITTGRLASILGPAAVRDDVSAEPDEIGVATGLAVTSIGGEVLTVEAALMPGTGNLILTGHLGDVMRESATAALTYARSHALALGIPPDALDRHDVHVHVPAGAIPKDGPSAGLTIAVALISAATRRPVHRRVALTGEITLRGRVLAVGGLKEKALGAYRSGIRELVGPRANQQDWPDVPDATRAGMTVHWCDRIDEVLPLVLGPSREDEPGAGG
ncbi:MAG: endopeptidase La [Dehalococcoidia bacterium]